ncbi:hypothetical protein E1R31_001640 [Listeria monocytogenes]|uniref:DUF1565 domain-containing protein n=1 Tax=Listeria seeligeri TaxID=1640 RepID=A0A7X0X1Q8_LISSE|nr:hypothetical protein [Listeria seeligeri]EAE4372853.1 hypothetical protein [Listeria monocytogenes]EAG8867208.1 hypothetical protein [Listeria monocytogenes]MBC1485980.1 hypothetical protein [Listeria seeligeri]HAB0528573.1 hypothetical protein [Listeria monocytogenes]HAB0536637.1 hypothetical protein [Listeria monocytogenes]
MLNLDKWDNTLFDSNKYQQFNSNMEKIEKESLSKDVDIAETNNRINNIVLEAGGNDITEVVDARTSKNGQIYSTLNSRLNGDYSAIAEELAESNNLLQTISNENEVLKSKLDELYGNSSANIEYYVSSTNGNDITGNGDIDSPFKTIQKAVDNVPKVKVGGAIYIFCEPGQYNEDVIVQSFSGAECFYIQPTNLDTVDPVSGQTGFFVKSILFSGIMFQCVVQGLNSMSTAVNNNSSVIQFLRCWYGTVNKCRFDTNLKSTDIITVFYNQSRGNCYGNYFKNQNVIASSEFMGHALFSSSNTCESTSNIGLKAGSGGILIKSGSPSLASTTAEYKTAGGQIF